MVVIPFVFYHGERGWDLGENFLDSFPMNSIPKEFLKFLPNFSIQPDDEEKTIMFTVSATHATSVWFSYA
jgi:hypothetical protein